MPTDLFVRCNLDLVYPPFLRVALDLAANCRRRNADYFATYGLRTFKEQGELYTKFKLGLGGRAAPAGKSAHNYGLAFDFIRDADLSRKGLQPTWKDVQYAPLGYEAKALGLVWGGSFGDAPHVQWPGYVTGAQLEKLFKLYDAKAPTELQRLAPVWRHLDAERAAPDWRKANPRLAAQLALY